MSLLKQTFYSSLVDGLEYCSSCNAMCGTSWTHQDRTFTLVMRDSSTNKIVICPSCKPDKKKGVFD